MPSHARANYLDFHASIGTDDVPIWGGNLPGARANPSVTWRKLDPCALGVQVGDHWLEQMPYRGLWRFV
jgi:hypothetical protein